MKKFTEEVSDLATSGADAEPLDSLLRQAQKDGFTPEETGEIWNRLGSVLVTPGARAAPHSSAGSAAAVNAWSVKTIVVLALGGVVAAGGLAGLPWHRSVPPAASSGLPVRTKDEREPRLPLASALIAGGPNVPAESAAASEPSPMRSPLSSPSTDDTSSRVVGPHRPSKGGPLRTGVNAADRTAGSPEAMQLLSTTPTTAPPQARVGAVDTNAENAETTVPAFAATRPPPSDPSPNEGGLLLQARRELESNPAATLRLTDQHSHMFPMGALVPEREVLAIEALARLGRLSEARARFVDFRTHFPHSPHLTRLETILGRQF